MIFLSQKFFVSELIFSARETIFLCIENYIKGY